MSSRDSSSVEFSLVGRGNRGRGGIRGRGTGRGGHVQRPPQSNWQYLADVNMIGHPVEANCRACDQYRTHVIIPHFQREVTMKAALEDQRAALLNDVEGELRALRESNARMEHQLHQALAENRELRGQVGEPMRDRKRPRKGPTMQPPAPVCQSNPDRVSQTLEIARRYISEEGRGKKKGIPDVITISGVPSANFDLLSAPGHLAHLLPAKHRVERMMKADRDAGMRPTATTMAILDEKRQTTTLATTIFQSPLFPRSVEAVDELLRKANTPGNYEAYYMVHIILWVAEHWGPATNNSIPLPTSLAHIQNEWEHEAPQWHRYRAKVAEVAEGMSDFPINYAFTKISHGKMPAADAGETLLVEWFALDLVPENAPGIHISDSEGIVDMRTVRGHMLVRDTMPESKKHGVSNRNRRRFTMVCAHLIYSVGLYSEIVGDRKLAIASKYSPRPYPIAGIDNLDVFGLANFFAEVGVSLERVADAWPWAIQWVNTKAETFDQDDVNDWEYIIRALPERLVAYGIPPIAKGALEFWDPMTTRGWPAVDLTFQRYRRILIRQRDLDSLPSKKPVQDGDADMAEADASQTRAAPSDNGSA